MREVDLAVFVNVLGAFVMCAFFAQPARAVEAGTYRLVLSSKEETVSLEVRCPTWHGTTVCEVAGTDVRNGAALPTMPPRTVGLDPLGGCAEPPQNEWAECNVGLWEDLDKALKFARTHIRFQPDAQRRKLLEPLFTSGARLSKCESLQQNLGVTLCELSTSPWAKPTLLYFVALIEPCDLKGPFCLYAMWPVFKTAAPVLEHPGMNPLSPQPAPLVAPDSQRLVAAYIDRLQVAIRGALAVPADTPTAARVAYRLEFDEDTGRVMNIYFTSGCYCRAFRAAVSTAVYQSQPLPLLQEEQRAVVGKRVGSIFVGQAFLETSAALLR